MSSSTTRSAATAGRVGSTPRSLRLPASEGSLWRLPVRNIDTASQCAASMTMWVVVSDISVVSPPMTPARPIGPESSMMTRSSAARVRFDVVERGQRLALPGAAHPDRARQLVAVVAVDRLAELEHDVVGDVDGQRDRPHPGQVQAAGQPGRGRRGRVEAGHGAGREDRAAGRVLDLDRVAVGVRRGDVALGRVVERGHVPEGEGRLAGDAAQRQRVGAVGVDLELDDLVAQLQQLERRRRRARPRRRAAR